MNPTHSPTRRLFLQRLGSLSASSLLLSSLSEPALARVHAAARATDPDPSRAADDESFWELVRQSYRQSPEFANLESGYYSPAAEPVLDAVCADARRINRTPSFFMRRQQDEEKEAVRRQLAAFAGVADDEVVITRNTTESLNTVIHGIELERGDAVLYCDREYPSMQQALEQRSQRFGTLLQKIELPYLPGDTEAIVAAYAAAITPATRVILISHVVYLTGQILPVRAVSDMAHARGIDVICDAAHSFAHLDFKIPDLDCDYLGSSLHKWLGAPLGNGLLYVRRSKIPSVWPLLGDTALPREDIRKLAHIGTHPVHDQLGISHAIRFHEAIGSARKEARLRRLKDYWVEQIQDDPRLHLMTPLGERSCAIANVTVDGVRPHRVAERLYDEHRVFTVAVPQGVRISPNLHARFADLDRLAVGLRAIADSA